MKIIWRPLLYAVNPNIWTRFSSTMVTITWPDFRHLLQVTFSLLWSVLSDERAWSLPCQKSCHTYSASPTIIKPGNGTNAIRIAGNLNCWHFYKKTRRNVLHGVRRMYRFPSGSSSGSPLILQVCFNAQCLCTLRFCACQILSVKETIEAISSINM
jgi:hypothetical protein